MSGSDERPRSRERRIAGLKGAETVSLARLVSGAATTDSLVDVFARGAWSAISEPGDGAAGGVVSILGAATALRALTHGWSADRVRGECVSSGRDEVAVAVASAWSSGASRWRGRLDLAVVRASFELASRAGVRLVVPGERGWPVRIDDLGVHAPIALWVRSVDAGDEDPTLFDRSIALVGARAATGYGEHVTLEASAGLVDRGFAIVSGAAYGIDGMAHRSAIASHGRTTAFLAGGLDRPYPSGHSALIDRVAAAGGVYSEVPCGAAPTKWRFLQRNRLIAAASAATVVLEAGRRSGSLNTAGHAATLGRPLGAVPGPVTSASSAGCHRLLREYDATCVTNAAEMAELVDPPGEDDGGLLVTENLMSSSENRVLGAITRSTGSSLDEIAHATGLPTADVQRAIGTLALDGRVVDSASGWRRP